MSFCVPFSIPGNPHFNEVGTFDVDSIVETIASSVEEQSLTIREISENISQASLGIIEVTDHVAQTFVVSSQITGDVVTLDEEINTITLVSTRLKRNASDLTAVVDSLGDMIAKFTI